jgi:hypothetical protein
MSSLHVDPELGRRAEIARQPQRRVGENRALTFDNSGDAAAGTRNASALADRPSGFKNSSARISPG